MPARDFEDDPQWQEARRLLTEGAGTGNCDDDFSVRIIAAVVMNAIETGSDLTLDFLMDTARKVGGQLLDRQRAADSR